jgi:hypothetical protein
MLDDRVHAHGLPAGDMIAFDVLQASVAEGSVVLPPATGAY